jgi:hypothetical protein
MRSVKGDDQGSGLSHFQEISAYALFVILVEVDQYPPFALIPTTVQPPNFTWKTRSL